MSTDYHNLPPPQSRESSTTYRPYYNEKNALAVKPLLDAIFDKKQSCFLSREIMGCHPSAMQNKINDGLRWLKQHSPDGLKYSVLRDHISCRRQNGGIDIIWKTPVSYNGEMLQPIVGTTEVIAGTNVRWFDKFTDWATKAKELDRFTSVVELGGIVKISDEDERALIKFCAPLGMELSVDKLKGTFEALR